MKYSATLTAVLLFLFLGKAYCQEGVCNRTMTQYVMRSRVENVTFIEEFRENICGWLGWGTCPSYRIAFREMTFYISEAVNRTIEHCCTGYIGNPPSCQSYCKQGCFNGGTCTSPDTCTCTAGWSGTSCVTDVDECGNPNTCGSLQQCFNTAGSYFCECILGYENDPHSFFNCIDINECNDRGRCEQVCENLPGTFRCACEEGYRLQVNATKCADIDECLENNPGCSHICVNTNGSYTCTCNRGYTLSDDKHNCSDIMECQNGMHNCSQRCIELEGGFSCACDEGYQLEDDEVSCIDINECEMGTSRCQQGCVNTIGSYNCSCSSGFTLDGDFTCVDVDECELNNGGCSQICNNTYGGYRCTCREGYRLEFDGFTCSGQPCPSLMIRNGFYNCSGPQITGVICTFECDHGYSLVGPMERTCLSNSKWSGNLSSCETLHCEMLGNPKNGSIILPCGTRLRTVCRITCSPGFYATSPNPVQQCDVTDDNLALWSEVPECAERRACDPNPCNHNGKCTDIGSNMFVCNCDGTGYTGLKCNILLINTPDIPALTVNAPMEFSLSAKPDDDFTLSIEVDDRNSIKIEPSSLTFSQRLTNQNISITASNPGLYKIEYQVSDNSLNYLPVPSVTILVSDDESGQSDYFDRHRLERGLLQPGCCEASEAQLRLQFKCPTSGNELILKSTCGWVTKLKELPQTAGIIFSHYDGYDMPIAIAGAKFESLVTNIDLQSLNTFEFQSGCIGCNFGSVGNVDGETCQAERISVNDIQKFLKFESLAHTYFSQSMPLIPDWLRLKAVLSNRSHDVHSYMVDLVHSDSLVKLQDCNELSALTDGLYSVMIFTGSLEVTLNSVIKNLESGNYPSICFATNLCKGVTSPLYITIPNNIHSISLIEEFDFMQDLKSKGWDIIVRNLLIGKNSVVDELPQLLYWNGSHFFPSVLSATYVPNMVTRVSFNKTFSGSSNDFEADWNFIGNITWVYADFERVFTEQTDWDAYILGSSSLNITTIVNGNLSFLNLINDTTSSLMRSGDAYNSMRCHGCPNPMGASLKLVYHIDGGSTGLFSTLLIVPAEEQFELRTQFSCPLDGFMFLDDDHNMIAISFASSCLGLRLGRFPILELETHLYMFDDCIISSLCPSLSTSDSNVLVWSMFPDSLPKLKLGYFFHLLPISDTNRTGLVATFSKDDSLFNAQLFNVEVSLFDIIFNVMATINQQQLEFVKTVNLFNKYPAKLKGIIEQINNWEGAQIQINGEFLDISSNIPKLLCSQIYTYVEILYNRSQSRVRNAKAVYEKAKAQKAIAITVNREREATMNESLRLVQQTESELTLIRNMIDSFSSELETANNEVRILLNEIDGLCTTMECHEICISETVCEDCQRNATTLIQGTCSVACNRTVNTTVIVDYETIQIWTWVPQEFCGYHCICSQATFDCTTGTDCFVNYICTSVEFRRAIVESREVIVPSICNRPCSEIPVQAPVTAQCCFNKTCYRQREDLDCLRQNEECQATRNVIYANLADEQRDATNLLQSLDEARARERTTRLRLMRHNARFNLVRSQFNDSNELLDETEETLKIARESFEVVKRENQLDLLEKVTNASGCGDNMPSYFEIQSVTFSTTIITQSPMTLAVTIAIAIPSINRTVSETVLVDFNRFQMSLQQAAVVITETIILNQRFLSKRRSRNVVNISEAEEVYLHFQSRCTDIENILAYLRELNTSISDIASTAISSMKNLNDNMNEIADLITFSSLTFNKELNIDLEKVEHITNTTVNDQSIGRINNSEEVTELLRLMQDHLLNGQDLANNLEGKVFQSWQAKMEYLHNKTSSAAGFACLGFSNCLQEIVDFINEMISGVPFNDFNHLTEFSNAAQDLLDLALLQNYSIISAVANTQKIYKVASDPVLYNYWCADPPKIIFPPPKRVTAKENTDIELRCEVETQEYTTYQWQKDCVQIPNQRNSTFLLTNVKLSDSGNYTCVVTNQVSSITSTNSSVEVQQFPSFFRQPENVDEYLGNWNGAVIKSNATGFPYPGFRWYFRRKGTLEFTQIPGEDQNELVIVPPLPENDGSYYCEAFNEQGVLRSRIVNLTVLDSTVVQLARTVYLNFTKLESDINSTNMLSLGSGEDKMSGSGFDMNISLTSAAKIALQKSLIADLNVVMSFGSTSLDNFTVNAITTEIIAISFTLYSENISYPEIPLVEVNQLAPKARVEWIPVWQRLQGVVAMSEFIITDGIEEYESNLTSLQFGMLNLACPPGKDVSVVNNFLCVSCPPGSYQIFSDERAFREDGRVNHYTTSKCVTCPTGYYQDEQGQTTCKMCPSGYTTLTTGVRLREGCTRKCLPGTFSQNGMEPCSVCPKGTYSVNNGSTSCVNCSDTNNRLFCPRKFELCDKCEHICSNDSTCACHESYTLSTNGYSCIQCAKVINDVQGLTILKPTWHVTICDKRDKSNVLLCSGNLLNDQWILTSAECVCGKDTDKNSLSLRLKKSRTCVVEEDGEFDLSVAEIHCHPNHNSSYDKLVDLALLKTQSRIPMDEFNNTLPLCLLDESGDELYSFSGPRSFFVYGLGNPTQVVKENAILAPARVSLSLNLICFQQFSKEGIDYRNNQAVYCTAAGTPSTCIGNPGSAVVSIENGGKITFAGVTSKFTRECGKPNSHTVSTKVQNPTVLKWIDDIIAERN